MLEKIVKYVPPTLKANKACQRFYGALMYCTNLSPKRHPYYKYESHRLKRFKDIYKGQRCFIIGNGPSILEQDLTRLKSEITFVVNNFPAHPQCAEITPTFLCLSDEDYSRVHSEWYDLVMQRTEKTIKFLPIGLRPIIKKDSLFPGHQVYFMNLQFSKRIWEIRSMSLDVTKGVNWGRTIIIDYCLPLSFYMGFSKIYLLGCDCDVKLDEAPDGSKAHFYGRGSLVSEEVIGSRTQLHDMVMKSYSVVAETFEHYGRKIYNAGIGGRLEVFERVNYDELF